MNLGLSVHSYIHFLSQHFSKDWLISFFFILCMKLRDHKYSKLTEPIYLEKFLLVRKRAKMHKLVQFICSSIMAAYFLRIGSLDLSHIMHEVEGP